MSESKRSNDEKGAHRKNLPKAKTLRNSYEMVLPNAGAGVTDTCSRGLPTDCWCSVLCSKGAC
ncbi:MAG: hypothetical protein K2X77_01025 [Candidatus Obscuribacterales bacterium]|jgi:hypothetical protein|nr:hypothetical protein [Candidatus Obscuribacterales bacterium]